MWVFCCGMQRSGSTLQFQIAARLLEDAGRGKRVEWVAPDKFPELRAKHAELDGYMVFKNHVCTDEMAAEFGRGNAIGIYSYRDLRDVFVSNMRKYASTFDQFWYFGFLESILWNYRRWTSLPRILVSRYETMIEDVPAEVGRIAAHLGLALDEKACRSIADEYSMERQKARIARFSQGGQLKQGYAGARYDPESNLHTDHINAGQVDGWKGRLSAREVALIEDAAGDWLVSHGYELSLGAPQRKAYALRDRATRAVRRLLRKLRMAPTPSAS